MVAPAQPDPADAFDVRASLVVVAAGTGSRLNASSHKALVTLGDAPLVDVTVRRLLGLAALDPVVVVGHPDDRGALQDLAARWPRPVRLTDGGARRQDSVEAGLAALAEVADAPPVVLVHDAARPFPPLERLAELARTAAHTGCAVLAVPVADTLRRARPDAPDLADATVSRSGLHAVQTPQAFLADLLRDLLARARSEGRDVTDEAHLFEMAGRDVAFVEGSRLNFKITTQDDLELARAVLARRPEGER